jgi:hypothetical protein
MRVTETPVGGGTGSSRCGRDRTAGGPCRGPGPALVAALRGCLDHDVKSGNRYCVVRLVVEDGAVTGGSCPPRGRPPERCVVLATRSVMTTWSGRPAVRCDAGVPSNTGDGLRMRCGSVRRWGRCVRRGGSGRPAAGRRRRRSNVQLVARAHTPCLIVAVVLAGSPTRRNYNARGAFHTFDPGRSIVAPALRWLCRPGFVDAYGVRHRPAPGPSWLAGHLDRRARRPPRRPLTCWPRPSPAERVVAQGHDDDFGRGDSVRRLVRRPQAVPRFSRRRPGDQGPFYAVELIGSALGTKGGPLPPSTARSSTSTAR